MSVRYYVDADTLGLAHVLVALRGDVTYPGDPGGVFKKKERPPCVVAKTETPDEEWIPVVAERGWVIITRDSAIQRRPHELGLVEKHGGRMFTIASSEKLTNWHMLEVVMCNWRRIEKLSEGPGPFIWTVTRTSMHQASFDARVNRERRPGAQKKKAAKRNPQGRLAL